MVLRELRDAILHLEGVIAEQIERCERLIAESGQRTAVTGADDHERKGWRLPLRTAALVLMRKADEQVVRRVTEHRVPLADARLEVLENRVVRVGEAEELCRVGLPADGP